MTNRAYRFINAVQKLAVVSLALLAGGCGGGGGGSSTTPSPSSYTVGGALSNLASGKSLVLRNSDNNDSLTLTANSAFTFSTALTSGASYAIAVLTQPVGQTCTVTNGPGTVANANVTNVMVICVDNSYTVGGTLSNLAAGKSLVLRNNGTDNLTLTANGGFTFATALNTGAAYAVTVLTQPVGQTCAVTNGSGTVANANVTNIAVNCVLTAPAAPNPTLSYGIKELRITWSAVSGATHYRLFENPDGVSGYTQIGTDITGTGINHGIALHRRVNARYVISACNSVGCTASAPLLLAANLVPAVGYVKASNTNAGDAFGVAVALSDDGNTLAIGARYEASAATGVNNISPGQADNSAEESGAVYVFVRTGYIWTQQAYVKASNTGATDWFGSALTLSADGNTLAVGARLEDSAATGVNNTNPGQADNSAINSGAVYVFTRSGTTWTQQAYVKASNTGAGDSFGVALALSVDGNTLAVGAVWEASAATGINAITPGQADNSAPDAGAVYVFTRSGSTWSQQAYVKASNTGTHDWFGYAVTLSGNGNTLAVGAYQEDSSATGIGGNQLDNSAFDAGAVYVFTRSGTTWTQQAYVKASNTGLNDQFGWSLSLSADGNTLAVGAITEASAATGVNNATPGQTDNSAINSGAVYVFTRSGTTWTQQAYVKASNTGLNDQFGWSLALSADSNTLAIGTRWEDSSATGIGGNQADNSAMDSGAVYLFTRNGSTWTQQAYVKASNTGIGDWFGCAAALSGDGNTLAVGACIEDSSAIGIGGNQDDDSAANSGAVYLY